MTKGLLISRNTKNNLHKLALLYRDNLHIDKFKSYRNCYNSLIRLSKKLYFERGFKRYKSDPKKTWDLLNEITCRNSKNPSISDIYINGSIINDPKIVANTFNKFFTNIGSEISDTVPPSSQEPSDNIPKPNNEINFDIGYTGQAHVIDIIKSLPLKSSTDLMGISSKLLKSVAYEISIPLSYIFQLSLEQGIFPKNLKTSRTVPIFKAGEKRDVDNYRPISLVCTLSKVLEKMVQIRLSNYLDINKLMSPFQFGFQKSLSTEHNLIHLTNYVGSALNNGEYCVGIFFDLKKAFDVVKHSILLSKLKKYGINGTALKWFKSYLENRTQIVDINGVLSDELPINCSVLQGSMLGPTLFLIFINDFPLSTVMKCLMFADDTTCLLSGKNLNELINLINTEMQKIAMWYRSNKMVANLSKTKYIIFHGRGKDTKNAPCIIFNGNEIGQTDNSLIYKIERLTNTNGPDAKFYKLLGVYFDEHFTVEKNIKNICAKLSKSLYFLKRAKNFISSKALKILYFALFHSHILYCLNITGCASQSLLNKIVLLQKKPCEF